MGHSDEWTDWHLTLNGWTIGNSHSEMGTLFEREIPTDRLLTKRYRELQTSPFSKVKVTSEIQWSSGLTDTMRRLEEKYPFPETLA